MRWYIRFPIHFNFWDAPKNFQPQELRELTRYHLLVNVSVLKQIEKMDI